jgi:hypothetical protein
MDMHFRRLRQITPLIFLSLLLTIHLSVGRVSAASPNFSSGEADARLYGVHEIALSGDTSVLNPFDTVATVTFTPPTGEPKTVYMFYDGGDTWRARVYVTETGAWTWTSESPTDQRLNGQSGAFTAVESDLRGMLKRDPDNPRQWITHNGEWFLNLNDTAYRFFNADEPLWQEYIRDNVAMGITSIRAGSLGGWGYLDDADGTWPWDGEDYTRYNLDKFQTTDERLQWMLDNYPDVYIQMIVFGNIDYSTEEIGQAWQALHPDIRERTLRYMLARWAAYPQLFWLMVNDMSCTPDEFPLNHAFGAEIGQYFAANDPWGHLLSVSPTREMSFCYLTPDDLTWVSYIHLQDGHAFGAELVKQYEQYPLHVFLGEDYYEQSELTRYFRVPHYAQRWLFWSWLLAGGSANYGGRYPIIQPYRSSADVPFAFNGRDWGALHGLDSVPYITTYFQDRSIDLSLFQPDDSLVRDIDGRNDQRRPELMRRDMDEFLIYHPNAIRVERFANIDPGVTPGVEIDLRDAQGVYSVEWYRADDGLSQMGENIIGGDYRELISPWKGHDFVLRLLKIADTSPTPTPLPPLNDARVHDGLQALYDFDEGAGGIVHDISGSGRPVSLHIENTQAVTWIPGGLAVEDATLITTRAPADDLIASLQATNELTIEAWVAPARPDQNGPARIVTLSSDANRRNFTLAQGDGEETGDVYDVRLRTTSTDDNGLPSLTTPAETLTTELTHVVYTRDVNGLARLYIDGQEVASAEVPGDFSNWGAGAYLGLANEFGEDRAWLGEYHLVAIYNRALTPAEVGQNYAAGAD